MDSVLTPHLLLTIQLKIVKILAISITSIAVFYLLKLTVNKTVHKVTEKRLKTILVLINNSLAVVIFTASILIILDELGINIAPLLVSIGITGVALGYGSQTLVKDFINGLFLLSEDQVREGDLVKIGDSEGIIERLTLRSIVIRSLDGAVHIIPNSSINKVSNFSRDWSQANIQVSVDSKQSIDKVMSILNKAAEKTKATTGKEILEGPEIIGIEDIQPGKVTIKIKIKTKPKMQHYVAKEYRYLLKKTAEEEQFEL